MSRATEWAERLIEARDAFNLANEGRPEIELGDDGRLKVFVMELGAPKLVASSDKLGIEMRPGTDELIEFALKVIETFVDESTDLKLLRRIAGAIELFRPGLTES